MSIAIVYLTADSFTTTGQHDTDYAAGQKLLLLSIASPEVDVAVVSASYSADDDRTTVVVTPADVAMDVYRVRLGLTKPASTCFHYHRNMHDAGYIPASGFSDEEVDNLQTIPLTALADAYKVLMENPAGTGFEVRSIIGTTNRVSVSTATPGQLIFSIPQDIHTGATPTFAGMKFTSLTGIVLSSGASGIGAVASTEDLAVLRVNAGHTAYEFSTVDIGDLADVDPAVSSAPALGDVYFFDGTHITRLPRGDDGQFLALYSSMPDWLSPALKNLSDIETAVTDSGAAGDLMVRGASKYDRLAKGSAGNALLIDSSGVVAWLSLALKNLSDIAATVTDSGAAGDLMVRGSTHYDRLPKGSIGDVLTIKSDGSVGWQAP